jgi:hypothetical protein
MLTHTRAFALALLLLLTQQLGALHSLSHGRLLPAGVAVAGVATATDTTAAVTAADAADATATDRSAADPTATDLTVNGPPVTELPADGLCQVCLLLVALGAAALPALLQWLAVRQRSLHRHRPALPARQACPGAPYLARAPPRGLPALT